MPALALAACAPAASVPSMTPLPSSCPGPASPIPTPHRGSTVVLQTCDFRFDPDTVVLQTSAATKLKIENTGSVLHNFTVAGTNISIDVAPGHASRAVAIGKSLAPGSYTIYCKYYRSDGMVGVLVVDAASSG